MEKNIEQISVNELKSKMAHDCVAFFYKKADGSLRRALGTLCFDFIRREGAEPASKVERRSSWRSPGVVSYYDLERRAWRSFSPGRLVGLDADYGI